ncbi:GAF and ANTAR domain-containing protein [Streptomyces sp. NPDC046909]|uniref:GAF and ANTAR domain-containing protein n=1 Tax=Streptomyces sp. NPDC046909 TaxID=3155617 RepID=UPI0033FB3D49
MASGGGAFDRKASAQRNADVAHARSAEETRKAERHEILAATASSNETKDMHLRIATVHRSTAACHETAASLQDAYAKRLAKWVHDRRAPQPLFMTGVAEACGTSSAALTLVGATLDQLALAASDEPARAAQELEFLLGEGPARDATREVRPVSASGATLTDRWPGYGPALADLGIAGVAAVPLSLEDTCVGALAVFDPEPGLVESGTFTEVAEALTRSMILSPDGDPGLYGGMSMRATVHQGAGMLSVQRGCSIGDALELIKAHAFAEGTSAHSVASRIVRGELRLG